VWAPGARLTYQWLRGGAPIAGATASVYTPTAADVGLVLSVEVTGSLRGFADVERSSAGVTVAALGRLAAGIPAVVGAARPGLTVTAHPGTWPAGAELSYQWVRSGRDIPGATEHEYVVTAADAGHALAVRVTGALPGWDSAAAVSISVTVEMDGQAAPNTEVRPAGSVAVGSKLSASPFVEPGWTATYQWLRDGQPIVGATEATYAPTKADIGHQVQVVVSKMKVGTDSVTVRSAAVTVPKVVPTVTAKLAVNSVKAGSTPKVRVTVKAKGLKAPTGKLTVKYGSKTKTVVLRAAKKGKITVALPGLAKKGTYKVAVSYGGNATAAAKTAKTVKLTVK
jgi:hypothetical protein